jgi:MoaA/NifB/PqqE/SkfB family radical SAM enzyme
MSYPFFVCIDYPAVHQRQPGADHLGGWCVCPVEILAVQVKLPTGWVSAHYGVARPDVAKAYPHAPNAGLSGFSVSVHPEFLKSFREVEFLLTVREDAILSQTYAARVSLRTNAIQKTRMRRVTRPDYALPKSRDLEKYLRQHLRRHPSLTLRMDIINKCNLRCIMCHCSNDQIARQPLQLYTPQEFKRMFAPLRKYFCNVMLSCAYEPLMSKHLPGILGYLGGLQPPLAIGLCSNGMLLNARLRRLLLESGVTYALFSLDGCTRATVERIRRGAQFDRLVANLLALRDLKQQTHTPYPHVTMDYVMMASNLHETPAFVEMCSLLGVRSIDFRHLVPSKFFHLPQESLQREPGRYNYYHDWLLKEGEKHKVEVYLPKPFKNAQPWNPESLPQVTLDDFRSVQPDPPDETPTLPKFFPETFDPAVNVRWPFDLFPGIRCHHPFSEIMLNNKTVAFPCPYYQRPLGNVKHQTLAEIFFGQRFQKARRAMFLPQDPECRLCPVKKKYFAAE